MMHSQLHRRALRRRRRLLAISTALLMVAAGPLNGQTRGEATEEANPTLLPRQTVPRPSTTAANSDNALSQPKQTGVGRAGQRQNRDATTGIVALQRLDTRVVSRVQTRLRTRIDRYYDPQANATSPFKVAGERLRRVQPRR